MRHVAIVNDSAEVVTMVNALVTHGGRRFLKLIGADDGTIERVKAFRPDLIVLPMHRRLDTLNRPIGDFHADIEGAELLELVTAEPAFAGLPLVVVGFAMRESDLPAAYRAAVRYTDFVEVPDGLQELNPIISAHIGPATPQAPTP